MRRLGHRPRTRRRRARRTHCGRRPAGGDRAGERQSYRRIFPSVVGAKMMLARVNARSLRSSGAAVLLVAVVSMAPSGIALADFSADLDTASHPREEGVPEVAVVRLGTLLKTNLKPDERRAVLQSLV